MHISNKAATRRITSSWGRAHLIHEVFKRADGVVPRREDRHTRPPGP